MNTFLLGRENIGWSIDYDRIHTELFLMNIDQSLVKNPLKADLVHAVWWNLLNRWWAYPLRKRPVIAVVSNDISDNRASFEECRDAVDLWVAPNRKTEEFLNQAGADVRYQPFCVDERLFKRRDVGRREICEELDISFDAVEGRTIVGSFQRDTLGSDLSTPKPEKNPRLLVEILDKLPREEYVLLLAGPRRHWILEECKCRGIPYVFCGEEPGSSEDDIRRNNLGKKTIAKLYNLIDLYVVSSRSEGGPKAILEAAFSETMILSTDVGLAPDVLDPWCLYEDTEEGADKLRAILSGRETESYQRDNYETAVEVAGFDTSVERWSDIYQYFKETYVDSP